MSAKERRKLRRQEHKAKQKLGHSHLIDPAADADDCDLKGRPGKVGMKRDPFEIQPPGQTYAVISWVAPHSTPQRAKQIAVKIRGVFHTKDEALAHAATIYQVDPDFDIHVVEMYEWLVIPPPREHQMQIPMEYNQAKLDRIMKGYYQQIRSQKRTHDKRVEDALEEGRRKATEWRVREGHTEPAKSLTKKLEEDEVERVPVLPRPEEGTPGIATNAIRESRAARLAVQEEMTAAGVMSGEELQKRTEALERQKVLAEQVSAFHASRE